MYKEVLSDIDGVAIYPIISLAILGTFFIGVVWYAVGMKKNRIEKLGAMPFEDDVKKDF